MGQRSIKNTPELANKIKLRRNELNLTIEEAAVRAGVGTKTWSRYEAGEAIRKDKSKGICKALNWFAFPGDETDKNNTLELDEFKNHKAWSPYLAEAFGKQAAVSFAIGSDILIDDLQEDIKELSSMQAGTHIGQLSVSLLESLLPKQFLMRYDYDFLYILYSTVIQLRNIAHSGNQIIAHSVMEELALYLIVQEAQLSMECMAFSTENDDVELDDNWDEWVFEILEDMDLVTFLYSDFYLTKDDAYHFNHWMDRQFFCDR